MRFILVFLSVTLLSWFPLHAQTLPEEAFFLPETVSLTQNANADVNTPEGEFLAGKMAAEGKMPSVTAKKGEEMILTAANKGEPHAVLYVAKMYRERGDMTRSVEWIHKAEKTGLPESLYAIAQYYEFGIGMFKNQEKAIENYKLAADKGVLNAMIKMGFIYRDGRGVPQNIGKAVEYLEMAALKNHEQGEDAEFQLKMALFLPQLYTAIAGNEQNGEKSLSWIKKAAELNHLDSQLRLADAYFYGKDTMQDYAEAMRWYMTIIEKDYEKYSTPEKSAYAMTRVAYMYSNGLNVDIDYKKAVEWYRQAAERGGAEAAWSLGNMYLNGNGVTANKQEADKWFARADSLRRRETAEAQL